MKKILNQITLRDILMLSGLILFGYGLYLFIPWVSYTVCGALILAGGFFMRTR